MNRMCIDIIDQIYASINRNYLMQLTLGISHLVFTCGSDYCTQLMLFILHVIKQYMMDVKHL